MPDVAVRMFAWTMIFCGLFACDTGFALVACLIASLRASGLARHPRVTMVIFAKIVARRFDARDALLQETLSRVEFCRKHCRARGIADRLRRPEKGIEDARLLLTRLNVVDSS